MTHSDDNTVKFEGEEAGAGLASPGLDLIAAAFLLALAGLVAVASLALPVPGKWTTAPGLLPFVTAVSLGAMAVVLGLSALRRRRSGIAGDDGEARSSAENRRALIIAGTVALYIAALQFLAFQHFFSVSGIPMVLSAFEPVTTIALATLIHLTWRGPLWITVLISASWTLTLSLVFQKLFTIPLPGSF